MSAETTVVDIANGAAAHAELTNYVIYLMGGSFLAGAMFSILLLILLDFMKRDRVPREPD